MPLLLLLLLLLVVLVLVLVLLVLLADWCLCYGAWREGRLGEKRGVGYL